MKRLCLIVLLLAVAATASGNEPRAGSEAVQLRGLVAGLLRDNAQFARERKPSYFQSFAAGQQPRATVVSCADARMTEQALDQSPDNDLYVVRDLGNQIATAEGSVEYGVRRLNTPLLIIVGHVACDAVKVVQEGGERISPALRRELAGIRLPARIAGSDEAEEWLRGVQDNVNNQVAYALQKFAPEVKHGKLTVLGTIYDFQNAMQQGRGRLVVTNVNGATDTAGLLSQLMRISGSGALLIDKTAADRAADNRAKH